MAKQKSYKTLAGAQKAAKSGFTAIELTADNVAAEGYPTELIGQFVVVECGTEAPLADEQPITLDTIKTLAEAGDMVLDDGRVFREVESGSWVQVGGDDTRYSDDELQAIADAIPEVKTAEVPNTLEANRQQSTVEKPVALVHRLTAEMLEADANTTRKQIMTAAQAAGVAYYTARTQVQIALKNVRGQRAAAIAKAGETPVVLSDGDIPEVEPTPTEAPAAE